MKLNQLLANAGFTIDNIADVEITGISYNSRTTKAGDLFFPLTGLKVDGHEFAADAVANGAVACIVERDLPQVSAPCVKVENVRKAMAKISAAFYGNPEKQLKLIGVTGTKGKTSVTHIVKTVLEHYGKKVGLIGTNYNLIGDVELPTSGTSPEAPEFYALLRKMADKGCEYCVMEVSSHALALDRVYGCQYAAAAFTNLDHDHLDFHKTVREYCAAKAKLFGICNKAVINIDNQFAADIISATKCEYTLYGIDSDCVIKASDIGYEPDCVRFTTLGQQFSIGVPGRFSVYNALCAIGICRCLDVPLETIAAAFSAFAGVKGRAESVPTGRNFSIIIDYAHTPESLRNILETVRGYAEGRIVALFGCGGDRDKEKRPVMGKIAAEIADFVIVTSDNPRTEQPMAIINEIIAGMKTVDCEFIAIENREAAIEYAITNAEPKDIIILAGKGHETYQIIGTEKRHLDEREVIRDILNKG